VSEPLIRRIRADEWRELKEIRLRALADAPEAFGTTLAEALAQTDDYWQQRAISSALADSSYLVVATEGERWLRLAGGIFDDAKFGLAQLISVWVDPNVRRAGLATKLVETVADWARARGATTMHLWVTETNDPARKLYRRLGFDETGESEPVRPGSSLQEIVMTREL
jgi:ribosomal protein S18 acetylase RimI-like enzyme